MLRWAGSLSGAYVATRAHAEWRIVAGYRHRTAPQRTGQPTALGPIAVGMDKLGRPVATAKRTWHEVIEVQLLIFGDRASAHVARAVGPKRLERGCSPLLVFATETARGGGHRASPRFRRSDTLSRSSTGEIPCVRKILTVWVKMIFDFRDLVIPPHPIAAPLWTHCGGAQYDCHEAGRTRNASR